MFNPYTPWTVVHDGPSRPMILTAGADKALLSINAFIGGKWQPLIVGDEELHEFVVDAVNAYQKTAAEIRSQTLKNLASAIKKIYPEVIPQLIEASKNPLDEFLEFLREE